MLHEQNCFISLTFDDKWLPDSFSVEKREWQLFAKRLRKKLGSKKIRFLSSGEYGDESYRPHYHALIFGHDWPDKKIWKRNKDGSYLYTSEQLSSVWPYGLATSGAVTYKSAAYVARYVLKKMGGELAADHYLRVHPLTGKLVQVQPEFATHSNKPGLGSGWFDKFKSDAFPSDFIMVDDKKHSVPRYYTQKLKEHEAKQIKRRRMAKAVKKKADQTPARLKVREEVFAGRIKLLKRSL